MAEHFREETGRRMVFMKRWKRKYCLLILCLAGCLALEGGQRGILICKANQSQTEALGKKGEEGIQGALAEGEGNQGVSDNGSMAWFAIDNQNRYEGMDKSYSAGYLPRIEGKRVEVVLPLLAKRKLSQNRVNVSLRFGESENLPFIQRNYEKAFSYAYHKTGNQEKLSGCYLISFDLELKKEYYNGNYPINLSVSAEDEAGDEISQEFTVYVTLTNGKEQGGDESQGTVDSGSAAYFSIDNQTVYSGMNKSYSKGYVPKVRAGKVMLVLPLQAKRPLPKKQLTASVRFGETQNLPFVHKNYDKVIRYGKHKTGKRGKKAGCYLVSFDLTLKRDYYNGSYPVTVAVTAQDGSGAELSQEFTVYVSLTGGNQPEGDTVKSAGENQPQFAPKVRIASCQFPEKTILCGKEYKAKLTLLNASKTSPVKSMLVKIVPSENVELADATGSSYVDYLDSGKTCTISIALRVKAAAPSGQYDIGVTMDYADQKGNPYTMEEMVKISAEQKPQLEIAPIGIPREIEIGETLQLQAQAMNLGKGKLYNVRASLEADGLTSSGLAFIGDLEAGTSMNGSVELTAEGLSGDSLYGTTQGKIIFYYEDEQGKQMTQEQDFETTILSPLKSEENNTPADDTRQWWIIMGVIAFCLVQAAVLFVYRRKYLAAR